MAADDERRLVEGRLRKLAERKVPCDIDCHLAEAVMGHDFCETPCDGCLSTVLTRLANLIRQAPTLLRHCSDKLRHYSELRKSALPKFHSATARRCWRWRTRWPSMRTSASVTAWTLTRWR